MANIISSPPGVINLTFDGAYFVNTGSGTTYTTPAQIINSNPVAGTLTANFDSQGNIFTSLNNYFILNSSNITFDGQNIPISVSVSNYGGFFNIANNGVYPIIVQNVDVRRVTGSLTAGGGWVGQASCAGVTFMGCRSSGDITQYGGGIVGQYSTNVHCVGCSSSGWIFNDGGGIFGKYASSYTVGSYCSAVNCFSSGGINDGAGGIFGAYANSESVNAKCSAIGCYNSSNFIYNGGGGIFGTGTNLGAMGSVCEATSCYSLGQMINSSGGIFGSGFNFSSNATTKCLATNCYSAGYIGSSSGGIFGPSPGTPPGQFIAKGCYSLSGNLPISSNGGSIFGNPAPSTVIIENCYGLIGGFTATPWNDADALAANPGFDVGYGNWYSVKQNTPFLLSYFTDNQPNPGGYGYTFISSSIQNNIFGYFGATLETPSVYPYSGMFYGYKISTPYSATTISANGTISIIFNGRYFTYNELAYNTLIINNTSFLTGPDLTINCNFRNNISTMTTNYIVLNTDRITFDGQNSSLSVSVADYPGLIRKTGSFSNITVQNININTLSAGSLLAGSGWVGGQTGWYGGNFINCNTSGNIPTNGGGIVGSFATDTTCVSCNSYGSAGIDSGGLFGAFSGNNSASVCLVNSNSLSGTFSGIIRTSNCFVRKTTPEGYAGYTVIFEE